MVCVDWKDFNVVDEINTAMDVVKNLNQISILPDDKKVDCKNKIISSYEYIEHKCNSDTVEYNDTLKEAIEFLGYGTAEYYNSLGFTRPDKIKYFHTLVKLYNKMSVTCRKEMAGCIWMSILNIYGKTGFSFDIENRLTENENVFHAVDKLYYLKKYVLQYMEHTI